MREWASWMGTPRAAGFVAGSWCCAAAALVANAQTPGSPWGAELLRWLASDGFGPGMLPITIAAIVALIHGMVIREARGRCCQEWIDAAWSLGLVAAGMAAWTWALHYEPFADPFSASRRLAALAGLGAFLVGAGMSISVAIAAERKTERPVEPRQFRRSYEAIS